MSNISFIFWETQFTEKMLLKRAVKEHLFFEKVRVRVRSSKIEVRCASAGERIIEVRVCVRHTVKFLATQHLMILLEVSKTREKKSIFLWKSFHLNDPKSK